MSFFGKFKSNATPLSPTIGGSVSKKDANTQHTALDRHLADLVGPLSQDGSDKFFGFENYGSTCYCNSIVQCLYFSPPFRERMLNFPAPPRPADSTPPLTSMTKLSTSSIPGPLAVNSPARRPIVLPGAILPQNMRPDEKDSPEYKKKILMQSAPFLDMQTSRDDSHGMDESLFTALKDIFTAIMTHQSHTGIVSPHKFLEILRKENEMFRSAMHQDAHEFLNLLLNQVVDCVELYNKKEKGLIATADASNAPKGWVHDLFEGLLVSETRCLTCETVSKREEAFMDLSVDLEAHSSVTACLRKFSEEEMLCGRNKFYCDNCSGLQEAEKRMKIKRLPRILALHLKRFEYTEDYGRLQKLFHRVVYPFHLRLFNTTDDAEDSDRLYELYAVVVHIGGGPYHGHYVSIIKTQGRGWLLFDDELVEPVDKSYVQKFFGGEPKLGTMDPKQLACAYVLFYQESTLEAVLKEDEAELQAETARKSADAVPPVNSPTHPGTSSLWANGLRHMHGSDPDKEEQLNNLTHAVTVPSVVPPGSPSMEVKPIASQMPRSTTSATLWTKSKKEARKEEKAVEKERKIAEKEADRLAKARRKEDMEATKKDRPKSGDTHWLAILEAAKSVKSTPAEETAAGRLSGDADAMESTATKSRRPGSVHTRQMPRFWAGKEKENKKDTKTGSNENEGVDCHGRGPEDASTAAQDACASRATEDSAPVRDDKDGVRRSRFGLPRKKSTVIR